MLTVSTISFTPHQFVSFANLLERIADASGLLTMSEKEILKEDAALFVFACVDAAEKKGFSPADIAAWYGRRLLDIIKDITRGDCAEYEENEHHVGFFAKGENLEVVPGAEAGQRGGLCFLVYRGRYSLQRA